MRFKTKPPRVRLSLFQPLQQVEKHVGFTVQLLGRSGHTQSCGCAIDSTAIDHAKQGTSLRLRSQSALVHHPKS